jgi:glycosyltransferase involved in cell wall biosynthesis
LANKTFTLYNFFDSNTILKKAKEPIAFKSNIPVLLSVGRLTAPKSYLRFLKILKKLKSNGYKFEWHVLGIGYQYDEMRKTISDYQLEDCVFLHGAVDNPYKYMQHCDLFVLPSGWEGFPTVTIEAKILKKPVLATNVSGIKEQMTHLKNGFIVENDENAIYEGLKFLLDNPHILETISSNEGMESVINNEDKYNQFIKLCE